VGRGIFDLVFERRVFEHLISIIQVERLLLVRRNKFRNRRVAARRHAGA
jgi:hypothetical protein